MVQKTNRIRPQAGFQTRFVSSAADIVIGGGAAGAGKTYALLMEYLRHGSNPKWNGVVFRRTMPMILAAGGIWETATSLYTGMLVPGAYEPMPVEINKNRHYIRFPSGSQLNFSHLQHEKDKLNWQGSQIGYLAFDELTHFSPTQFFYLLTRNRSQSGIAPYCRATTNPQGTGWVKDLIQWWIYPDDHDNERLAGYPIAERAGVLRYFTRYKSQIVWGDTPEQVLEELPAAVAAEYNLVDIKSLTFIPGQLSDNKILNQVDPGYKGNLLAQDEEIMQQLLKGRWSMLRDDEDRLFPYNRLNDAFTNTFVPGGDKFITADIALEGSDKFVVGYWSGYRLETVYAFNKTTGRQVLEKIQEISRIHGVPNSHIVVDADGVGGYLPSFLRGAHSFRNGGSPIDVDNIKQNYDTLRSQCLYLLAQKIKDYEMYFNGEDSEVLIDKIIEELYPVKKVLSIRSKLSTTPKKLIKQEIGHSPDYADMIMMRMYFDLISTSVYTSSTAI